VVIKLIGSQDFFDKFIELANRLGQIRSVRALRDGMILTMPFTIGGSIFLLIANVPISGYSEFMSGIFGASWTDSLNAVASGTFGALALIVVVGTAYNYVYISGGDASLASMIALATFLILLPPNIITDNGDAIGGVIPRDWIGSNGIITAIVVAFFVSYIFVYCQKKNWGIKLPDSVPLEVARTFDALPPAIICFTTAAVIYGICHHVFETTLPELFFKAIQLPLQGLSDTLIGGIIITALQSVLFWAGIHGPNVVNGVVAPLLLANTWENQQLFEAGQQLLGNPAAHIFTMQLNEVFTKSGGCGFTMGFLIACYFVAKSEQIKSVSKIALVPGLFNINEPIIFGLPIVFNPYMIVPFILAPTLAMIITYFSIAWGFMAPFSGMQVPWTTPTIISGFLLNGWQGAVVQTVNLIVATLIYLPFVKMYDKILIEEEDAQKGLDDEN
jgi:PTS system cellobiose-specific IIC component